MPCYHDRPARKPKEPVVVELFGDEFDLFQRLTWAMERIDEKLGQLVASRTCDGKPCCPDPNVCRLAHETLDRLAKRAAAENGEVH